MNHMPVPVDLTDDEWTDREPHAEAAYAAENLAAWLTPPPLSDEQIVCLHVAGVVDTPKETP